MPSIVVLLDNFTEFKEAFGADKDDVETPLTKYIQLARAGKACGSISYSPPRAPARCHQTC